MEAGDASPASITASYRLNKHCCAVMTDVINFPSVEKEVFSNSVGQIDSVHLINENEILESPEDEDENTVTFKRTCDTLSKEKESSTNNSDVSGVSVSVHVKPTIKNVNNSDDSDLCTPIVKKEPMANDNKNYLTGMVFKKSPSSTDIKSSLTCPYCQKKFENVSSFDKHKEMHLGSWPFMCKICHKGFPFHHLLESHVSFHKTETFPCYTCDKMYLSRYKLKAHMKMHINQFFCRICKESFLTKECLKSHKTIHKKPSIKKQIYICSICSAKFPLAVELKAHLRMHTSDWPFSCDVCKKLYRRRGSFLTHRSQCLGMKPYTCDLCNKTFIRQCHFIQHVQQMHDGVRPFSCSTCHKRFNSKSNLEIHSQVHSARLPTIYKCSLCQQMFNSLRKLRGHKIREHSLYRPYKCSTCKKIFIFKSQLSNHSKEHKIKEL